MEVPDRARPRRLRADDRRQPAPRRPARPRGRQASRRPRDRARHRSARRRRSKSPSPRKSRARRARRSRARCPRARRLPPRARAGAQSGASRRARPAAHSGRRGRSTDAPLPSGRAASTLDLLVVGLGNPGREYASTRHNVGFMVADELARRHGGSWRAKFSGEVAEVRIGRRARRAAEAADVHERVGALGRGRPRSFYKVEPERCSSCTTRSTSTLGRMQARLGGGLAGHNGLRSVAQHLETPEFLRLRIGVGRPERGDPRPVADLVLSPFDGGRGRRGAGRPRRRCGRELGARRARGGAAAIQRALARISALGRAAHVARFRGYARESGWWTWGGPGLATFPVRVGKCASSTRTRT